jgi:hypothetical protein
MDDGAVEWGACGRTDRGWLLKPSTAPAGLCETAAACFGVRVGWRCATGMEAGGVTRRRRSAFCVRGPRTAGILHHFRYAYTGDC